MVMGVDAPTTSILYAMCIAPYPVYRVADNGIVVPDVAVVAG